MIAKAALIKTNPSLYVDYIEKRDGSKIQSLMFDKNKYTKSSAQDWAQSHGFKASKSDVTYNTIILEQDDTSDPNKTVTQKISDGIEAVFGVPKTEKSLDQVIKEGLIDIKDGLVSAVKDMNKSEISTQEKFSIFKTESEKQIVYGVVIEPWTDVTPNGDAHGDRMSNEEIEKSAHDFMMKSQEIKSQHSETIEAQPVESYIAPADFSAPDGEVIKQGSWVMAVKIHDNKVWDKVKKGEITAFSPGGFAKRLPLKS